MLSETGAAIEDNIPGLPTYITVPYTSEQEVSIKQTFWRAIFQSSISPNDGPAKMPKMKAAVWFEEIKEEEASLVTFKVIRDFRITHNPAVLSALTSDLKVLKSRLTTPSGFTFSCNGNFEIKTV